MTSATPVHPGTVTFIDDEGRCRVLAADQLPPERRFAATPSGLKPVVRVVATANDRQQHIAEYGPEGELLRRTVCERSTPEPERRG